MRHEVGDQTGGGPGGLTGCGAGLELCPDDSGEHPRSLTRSGMASLHF